jgi:hypothetical protein
MRIAIVPAAESLDLLQVDAPPFYVRSCVCMRVRGVAGDAAHAETVQHESSAEI